METGKTVLIAGASRGLGWCLAKKYLEDGWNVLDVYKRQAWYCSSFISACRTCWEKQCSR